LRLVVTWENVKRLGEKKGKIRTLGMGVVRDLGHLKVAATWEFG
jgi:hypothetical protein